VTRRAPAWQAGDVVLRLSQSGAGNPDRPPPPEDLPVPWEGVRTWAGRILWDEDPMAESAIERVYLGQRMDPLALDEVAYFREEETPPETGGLSVVRTIGPRVVRGAIRVILPESSLEEWSRLPRPPPVPDIRVPAPKRRKAGREIRPAAECKNSDWWRRYRARMAGCRSERAGRRIYGSNGAQEFLEWAPCNLAGCGCRKNDVARRGRAIRPLGLMTLTFKHDHGPVTRDEAWVAAFAMMHDLFRWFRKRGHDIGRYVAVKEAHVSGWPHLHIVTENFPYELGDIKRRRKKNGAIDFFWAADYVHNKRGKLQRWRDEWVRLGGGFIVEWEALRNDGCYIAKYVDKQDKWPEDVLALVAFHDARAWTSSKGLKAHKGETAWVHASGSNLEELEQALRLRQARSTRP